MEITGDVAFLLIMAAVLIMAIGSLIYFRYKDKHPEADQRR